MTIQKTIEQKFRKLSEVAHVLHRPGRYIGSITPHTESTFVYDTSSKKMVKREVTYNPGFLKLFDEVISNSVDHSKRPEGKHLDVIRVEVDEKEGSISIFDNGGIPVVKHSEYNQWVPELIFELRAGSNFDDDDQAMLTGQNGEGAALTNIFSKKFIVETCDGKNKFKMVFEENSQDRKPAKVTPAEGAKGYTKITYFPDWEKLGATLTADNVTMLMKRVADVAGLNTHLKVYWNGDRIPTRAFKDYIEMYLGENEEYAYDETDNWKVAVAASDDGFQHISFVNGTHTKIGGTHILYAGMQIWERVREFIKKKHKVDIRPSELRQHMTLFIDCSIVNPRYSSQTKDDLITEVKDYKTSWDVSDKMINKIVKSSIIQNILDWAEAKAKQEELKELRKLNKDAAKTNPKRIEKFDDAVEKKDRHLCEVFFTEGDSARLSIQSARGKNKYIGSFSLRGKPLNVYDSEIKDIIGNNEFANMLVVTGLQIGEKVTAKTDLRFGKLVILSDNDLDGFHVSSLLLSFWAKYWPELFKLGMVYRMNTPLFIATTSKGEIHEFFTEEDYEKWSATAPKHKADYFKGLGGFDTETFERFISNREKYLTQVTELEAQDLAKFELAFSGKEADSRKEWLQGVKYFEVND